MSPVPPCVCHPSCACLLRVYVAFVLLFFHVYLDTWYCERIIPLIHGWFRLHLELQLMQDGAPGHVSGYTLEELVNRGIQLIFWTLFSPNLNPIETLWNITIDWIQSRYGEGKLSYDRLRQAVTVAWEAVGQNHS